MEEESNPQLPGRQPQPSAGGYWSTPADDVVIGNVLARDDAAGSPGTADTGTAHPGAAGFADAPRPVTVAVSAAAPGASDSSEESGPMMRPPRAPSATLGWVAIGLAAVCVIADVVAVVLAVQRHWVSATLIAEATNLATAIVFVVGLFAAFRRPARWFGIAAMIVAILANPFILTHLLAFLGG